MKKPKTTALAKPSNLFYGKEVIRVDGDLVCLTDMWRAEGAAESKRPAEWLRHDSTQAFIEHLETVGSAHSFVQTVEGRSGGTFAHWQVALAYAKYLSPAFHVWCNEVVRVHMEGLRHDPDSPALRATMAARRLDLQEAKLEVERTKLEVAKAKLDMENRARAAKMLTEFSTTLRANNQNDLAQTLDVKAIEFVTGDKYAFALPANTTADWQSPTQIAEATGATPNLVGRVISSLGLRGDIEGTCRPLLGTAKEGTKTVPVFIYSPEAVKQITTAVRARMAPKAS